MKHLGTLLSTLLLAVTGCGQQVQSEAENTTAEKATAQDSSLLNVTGDATDVPKREASNLPAAEARSEAPAEPDETDEPDVVEAAEVDMCWQDYCPCDPPQGGPDQMICRRLRAGLPVDDELMSSGAGMRDVRQQLEDFERDNPGF